MWFFPKLPPIPPALNVRGLVDLVIIVILFGLWWFGLFTLPQLFFIYLLWLAGKFFGGLFEKQRSGQLPPIPAGMVKKLDQDSLHWKHKLGLEPHPGEVIWQWPNLGAINRAVKAVSDAAEKMVELVKRDRGRPPEPPQCDKLAELIAYRKEHKCTWQEAFIAKDVSEKWYRVQKEKCKKVPP